MSVVPAASRQARPAMRSSPAASAAPSAAAGTTDEGYVIGPGDVVDVSVLGREEFHPRVQVQADGTVQLPYLHSVKAADLTVIQFREQVNRLLRDGGFYTDPVVNVAVVSYISRYVTVLGEFGNPGLVPVDRVYRVSEILARAGGAKPSAADDILLRRADGKEFRLPVTDVARGGAAEDPYVQPGDKLFLAAAPIFYVYGQVGAPGAYKVERGMTIRMALARSGGLTQRGSAGKISVYRNGQKVKATMDMKLSENDTIFVGERFF
ncbi:polysaccharide export protein [Novosphingobium sp. G106]|uniref:SLBB domain-containing protein n=1 Tax=Novosphingobium sp. G106 TaxID=2849500 RepID=UPI001C2D6FF7|nr:polysaccharide biosynthesis/export family protein [Novosphingobium sp. G106]MBV1692171.1 polysaccharide export protein [Novosphingobium sp. G106]MBV1692440.1 polysaccharide export protein [Novosphingobium sp. G106]